MKDLSSLSKSELETLLKELKRYRATEKKLGKRAKSIFSGEQDSVRVELAPNADSKAVSGVLAQIGVSGASVSYSTNPRLSGGARIFIGDDLVALSFDDIIQKI